MRRLLLALGVAVLAAGAAATEVVADDCAPTDTVCKQLQDAKQSQTDVNRRLRDIQQSLANTQQKADQTLAYINDLNGQIAGQLEAIAQASAKLRETERQIRLTEAEIARQEAHLQVRQELLAQRVRALDKHGSVNYLELVATSRSFNELVDRIVLMQEIVRSDQRLVDTLRQQRDQIQRLRETLQQEHDQEAALLRQQKDQETQLERTRQGQQQAYDYYRQLEAQFDAQRQALEAEKSHIDALVNQLQAQYDAQARDLGGGSGRFAWPERGPITQPFGCTDLLFEPYDASCATRHFHTGIDIGAAPGTPIEAADAGVVSYVNSGWGGGYGNYVLITHGNGYATLYAHLSAIYVSAGQGVQRGESIGAEGSTGLSTGPHLHFEVRYNGAYQNPLSYLS